jgi:hypothetical protein
MRGADGYTTEGCSSAFKSWDMARGPLEKASTYVALDKGIHDNDSRGRFLVLGTSHGVHTPIPQMKTHHLRTVNGQR